METQTNQLDILFKAFYSAHQKQDLVQAEEYKQYIFDALVSKGKGVYDVYNGKPSVEVLSFNSFMSKFSSLPNPFSANLETIRIANRFLFKSI